MEKQFETMMDTQHNNFLENEKQLRNENKQIRVLYFFVEKDYYFSYFIIIIIIISLFYYLISFSYSL